MVSAIELSVFDEDLTTSEKIASAQTFSYRALKTATQRAAAAHPTATASFFAAPFLRGGKKGGEGEGEVPAEFADPALGARWANLYGAPLARDGADKRTAGLFDASASLDPRAAAKARMNGAPADGSTYRGRVLLGLGVIPPAAAAAQRLTPRVYKRKIRWLAADPPTVGKAVTC